MGSFPTAAPLAPIRAFRCRIWLLPRASSEAWPYRERSVAGAVSLELPDSGQVAFWNGRGEAAHLVAACCGAAWARATVEKASAAVETAGNAVSKGLRRIRTSCLLPFSGKKPVEQPTVLRDHVRRKPYRSKGPVRLRLADIHLQHVAVGKHDLPRLISGKADRGSVFGGRESDRNLVAALTEVLVQLFRRKMPGLWLSIAQFTTAPLSSFTSRKIWQWGLAHTNSVTVPEMVIQCCSS